jgi:hypothetical protein
VAGPIRRLQKTPASLPPLGNVGLRSSTPSCLICGQYTSGHCINDANESLRFDRYRRSLRPWRPLPSCSNACQTRLTSNWLWILRRSTRRIDRPAAVTLFSAKQTQGTTFTCSESAATSRRGTCFAVPPTRGRYAPGSNAISIQAFQHGDQVPLAACLDPQHTEAGLVVVVGYPFDQASQSLRLSRRWRGGGGPDQGNPFGSREHSALGQRGQAGPALMAHKWVRVS